LRPRRQRPRRRTPDLRDELAPSQMIELHSILTVPGTAYRMG
jgi:hypothetical protein